MMMAEPNIQKKGFISRLLTNPNTPKDYSQPHQYPARPKYESILGIQHDPSVYPVDSNTKVRVF